MATGSTMKDLKEFSIQRSADQLGATGSVTLDNQLGQEVDLATTQQARMVTLAGYWVGKDGVLYPTDTTKRAIFSGWGMPHSNVEQGSVNLTLDLFDISDHVTNCKKLSDTFPLDGLYVYDALIHLASWCGLKPNNCNFENLGTKLNMGPWEKELFWYTDSSENIVSLMQEICDYDMGAALWVAEDGRLTKGCPHCRQPRGGLCIDSNYAGAHFGSGSGSAGCLAQDLLTGAGSDGTHFKFYTGPKAKTEAGYTAADVMMGEVFNIDKPFLEVDHNYYNCVRVKGPTTRKVGEDSVTVDMTDWPSVCGVSPHPQRWAHSVGYKKTLERSYGWAVSDAYRRMVAYCLWDQHRMRPEYQTVVVPFLPEVRLGNVFRIYGKAAKIIGATDKLFRVGSYAHQVGRGDGRERATTVTGRFMKPVEDNGGMGE
ncbi:MAG: hypothetical protein ACYC63_04865 [Armatimonadota bacterium]